MNHFLDNSQPRQILDEIFAETKRIKDLFGLDRGKDYLRKALKHKRIVLLFSQPSTRTRAKFEWAAKILGADTLVVSEIARTSIVKGENWRNTIKTYAYGEADIIVIRDPRNFAPMEAAKICDYYGFKTKIINAGDGNNLHPTQALQDLYTMKEHFGEKFGKEKLKIAIGADLKNAHVLHSLVAGLAQYPVRITLVSKKNFSMPEKYLNLLIENKIEFKATEELTEGEKFDAMYWVRLQTEHIPDVFQDFLKKHYNRDFKITPRFLKTFLREDGVFLHPGPRAGEIDDKIDADLRVKDGNQVENGLYTGMAILKMMLNPNFRFPRPSEI